MSRRGPHSHTLWVDDARTSPSAPGARAYSRTGDGPWVCDCGEKGDGLPAAQEHQRVKAKAAFKRLSDAEAFVTVSVSRGGDLDQSAAMLLLQVSRSWYGSPLLRKYMIPYYGAWGSLSARLDWLAVSDALGDGSLTAEPDDEVVLRFAVAIAGVPVSSRLTDLRRLPEREASVVLDVVSRWLHLDGE